MKKRKAKKLKRICAAFVKAPVDRGGTIAVVDIPSMNQHLISRTQFESEKWTLHDTHYMIH